MDGRAKSALALGRREESDQALDRLQALDKSPGWDRARAYDAFDLGDFATAARDARSFNATVVGDAESAAYVAFVGAICLRRLNRGAEADTMLAGARPALTEQSWPSRIMDFMQGRLRPDDFLASAKGAGQQTPKRTHTWASRRCRPAGLTRLSPTCTG